MLPASCLFSFTPRHCGTDRGVQGLPNWADVAPPERAGGGSGSPAARLAGVWLILQGGLFLVTVLVGGGRLLGGDPGVVDFDRQVRPILSDNCFACHGPDAAARLIGGSIFPRACSVRPTHPG